MVAQAAATIDRLSEGRFTLGVGTGENLNEGPLGYPFPKYAERAARMEEALEIMRRLLDGEKLTYQGEWYRTDRARLYSPPIASVPIWMAAGGPKSAALAARKAECVITSVKDPAATKSRVIDPAGGGAPRAGRPRQSIAGGRGWILASTTDEAWEALEAWRGLRAPGRLQAVDPEELRRKADEMDRSEILSRYSIVETPEDYVAVYAPLVADVKADVVTIQTTSLDQAATIRLLGDEVLPALREMANSA